MRRATGSQPSDPLCNAWSAAAAATQLEFGLVLPQLTPAAMVALWRRAGVDAVASLGVQATAATVDVRPLGGPAATANTAALAANAPRCKSCDAGSPAGSIGVRPDAQEGLA